MSLLLLAGDRDRSQAPSLRSIAAEHWGYSRWALATNVVGWLPANLYFLVLPVWYGLEATGGLKALLNLAMPVLQANVALATLLVPAFSALNGRPRLRSAVLLAAGGLGAAAAAYGLLLSGFAREAAPPALRTEVRPLRSAGAIRGRAPGPGGLLFGRRSGSAGDRAARPGSRLLRRFGGHGRNARIAAHARTSDWPALFRECCWAAWPPWSRSC